MSSPPVRVLVVDDHEMFVESLVRLLNDEPDIEVSGVAHTARAALERSEQLRPDVVLLDYRLPDGDAPSCIERLAATAPSVPVLVMTGLGDDATLLAARDAGCAGVVTKQRAATELVDALRRVAHGATDVGDERLKSLGRPQPRFADSPDLTRRELAVLTQLAQSRSTAEIARELHVSTTTVRNHIQRILGKLGVHSRLEAVNEAVSRNIVDRTPLTHD